MTNIPVAYKAFRDAKLHPNASRRDCFLAGYDAGVKAQERRKEHKTGAELIVLGITDRREHLRRRADRDSQ